MDLLNERYGDEQAICDGHFAQIYSLSDPVDTLSSLRNFYDTAEANLRALEARQKVSESDSALLNFLQQRLPGAVRVKLEDMLSVSGV